ncbi:Nn.00g054660.m01.CDS01 [Neocucurbitaria sp. VM-36]
MRRKARVLNPPLQQADFFALPVQVQRKYFSSLERLQIQQQAFEEPTSGRSSRASSSTPFRPSLTLGSRRRLRKPENVVQGHDISQAQVDFFLALPEKLRKQHFSREEQVLLLEKHQQASSPPSDGQDLERAQQRFNDFQFDFSNIDDDISERGRRRRRSFSASPSVSPSRLIYYQPITKEKKSNRVSSLLYLHTMGPSTSTRNSLRRTMSLTSPSVRQSSSAAVLMTDPPLFAVASSPRHDRAHSASLSGRRSSHTPTAPVFDAEATHYQDPEARKKLRTYLASPQKFDEAIEFGFPSTGGNDNVMPHYQLPPIASHARKFSRDMHSFLKDGKLSFLEDNSSENQGLDSDQDSVADVESPTTPSSAGLSFRLHSRTVSQPKFSMDSSGLPPLHPVAGHLNREMTLRMTLTRPDLRADDDQLYGWQPSGSKAAKDDPLALEELLLTDDMTGTKGAFYIKPKSRDNLVTRLLKRASLKSR